jgi:Transposase IS66 family
MAPPAVVYVFAEDRKGERATDLFAGFSGILQVDGYARDETPSLPAAPSSQSDRRNRCRHGHT